jgi:hypothetical protein
MDDGLYIEIEDEISAAPTRKAERLGLQAKDHARRILKESVRNDSAPLEAGFK